jgi:hypothetical protein
VAKRPTVAESGKKDLHGTEYSLRRQLRVKAPEVVFSTRPILRLPHTIPSRRGENSSASMTKPKPEEVPSCGGPSHEPFSLFGRFPKSSSKADGSAVSTISCPEVGNGLCVNVIAIAVTCVVAFRLPVFDPNCLFFRDHATSITSRLGCTSPFHFFGLQELAVPAHLPSYFDGAVFSFQVAVIHRDRSSNQINQANFQVPSPIFPFHPHAKLNHIPDSNQKKPDTRHRKSQHRP